MTRFISVNLLVAGLVLGASSAVNAATAEQAASFLLFGEKGNENHQLKECQSQFVETNVLTQEQLNVVIDWNLVNWNSLTIQPGTGGASGLNIINLNCSGSELCTTQNGQKRSFGFVDLLIPRPEAVPRLLAAVEVLKAECVGKSSSF